MIAAEDRGYWTEGGISMTGLVRAAYDDVTFSNGGNLSGGSTITQEFVRNYYAGVGLGQTASRKIKEIFIAQKLAKAESKQWVLEHYLNLIYLGDSSYGVSAAAETYFGKPVSELSVAQDAIIAAIIQSPYTYPLPVIPEGPHPPLALQRARRHGEDERPEPGAGERASWPRPSPRC